MNRSFACYVCVATLTLAVSACYGLPPQSLPTATPTQLVVSTPFTLPEPKDTSAAASALGRSVTRTMPAGETPVSTHQPSFSKTLFITQTGPTQRPDQCDQASAGNPIDVTIPDYAVLYPGEHFVKTWRLVNSGSCTWSSGYAAVWFSGDHFGAPQMVEFSREVPAGQQVDITVDMTAPENPGSYQSNWKLSNDLGELFGIGPAGDAPIWVRIVVEAMPETPSPPAASPTPAPQVLVSGLVTLASGDSLDLDTNRVSPGAESDLAYDLASTGGAYQLSIKNGGLAGSWLHDQPGMAACTQAGLDSSSLSIQPENAGLYFCYKTNLGLPGWGRLVLTDSTTAALTLEILTWNMP